MMFAHNLGLDAPAKEKRRRRMAEVMEADERQLSPFQQRVEVIMQQVHAVEWLANGVGEHELLIVPHWTR
jgi:hypothetical protein